MQRNIEHEHGPENTEHCRVVSKAVSLSGLETSQLLPRSQKSNRTIPTVGQPNGG